MSEGRPLGLLEAAALLRSRKISAVELLAQCQAVIEQRNGGQPSFDGAPEAVNAWVGLYPERAERQARAADERLARERDGAPLVCGIPIALKDLYAVKGLPLTASSRVLEGNVADADCEVWSRLHAQGMVLVGHTHTHEFAAGGTTDQVANPHDLARSAGGSSGGSGAALAAGMVPAALGTDTAGSLRIPAALCGVSTIKPTHGRVPIDGVIPLAPSFDHSGPMARSVADCAALLEAMARGGGQRTPLMPPPQPLAALATTARAAAKPLAGARVALTDRPARAGIEHDVAHGLDSARAALERLGAETVQIAAPAIGAWAEFTVILLSEAGAHHARYAERSHLYRTSIREFVQASAAFTSSADYIDAQAKRAATSAAWEDWFAEHALDAVLEPTVPTTAPLRGEGYDSGRLAGELDPLIALTATWDTTGFPVVALPAGRGPRSGLPVGVSLIAPRGREGELVRLAVDLQEHELG
ncbi:MAG TPA: amidase [Solirubrobacteraceae bacterium]|jgi:aspartyl-tRNA(Asn)/glutamyl-tRNA(Gln) amidotransferase subunit A